MKIIIIKLIVIATIVVFIVCLSLTSATNTIIIINPCYMHVFDGILSTIH